MSNLFKILSNNHLRRFNSLLISDGREILNVVGEVHRVSERGIKSFDQEISLTLVLKANKELDDVSSRKFNVSGSEILSGSGEENSSLGKRRNIFLQTIGFLSVFNFGLK